MTWLANFLIFLIYSFIITRFRNSSQDKQVILFVFVLVHATLFRCLANPFVYLDTQGYDYAFYDIASMTFKEVISINRWSGWGQGYVFFNWLISRVTSDSKWLFIMCGAISVPLVIWYYYKSSNKFILTVSLFLLYPAMYNMGFSVLRQHIAISFVLMALLYEEKKRVAFPLLLIASLFHTSALVVAMFFLIRNIDVQKFNLLTLLGYISLGLVAAGLFLSNVVVQFDRYSDIEDTESGANNIVPVLILGSFILYSFVTGLVKRLDSREDKILFNYMLFGLIVAIFGVGREGMGRLALYFLYAFPSAITMLYKYSTPKVPTDLYVKLVFLLIIFMIATSRIALKYDYEILF